MSRGTADWEGNIVYSDADRANAIDAREGREVLGHNLMKVIAVQEARITELVTRMGALDGAIERLTRVIAIQDVRINALEAMVRPTRAEVELVHGHRPSCNTAQVVP